MLTKEGGFGGSPVDLNGCGLAKSEGYPRANNTESAPVKGTTISEARSGCSAWHRVACHSVRASHLTIVSLLVLFYLLSFRSWIESFLYRRLVCFTRYHSL